MRVSLVFLIAALLGLFLQGTLIHGSFPAAVTPDLVLVLIVVLSQRFRNVPSLLGVFALGLFADFASGEFVGPNAAAAIVVFALVGMIAKRVYADHGFTFIVIAFLCSLAKSATVLLLILLYTKFEWPERRVLQTIVYEAGLTALFAPIVYKCMRAAMSARSLERHVFKKVRPAMVRSKPSYNGLRE